LHVLVGVLRSDLPEPPRFGLPMSVKGKLKIAVISAFA
jgi:hypothetical protein